MTRTVGIIGLGLLGASLAKALRAYTTYDVIGYARRQEICDVALAEGCVSQAFTIVEPVITGADIVVFALPPETNGRLFEEVAHLFRPGQVVTDVSSAKDEFASTVYAHIPEGVHFVSIHPMAGSEKGGYEEAHQDLFQKMGWIILEDEVQSAYDATVARELAGMGRAVGSRIEYVEMEHHDEYLAMVSHMPHMLASIMITTAGGDELGDKRMSLSAGGLRDSTRTASGLPSMWQEIIYGNRMNVLKAIENVEQELATVKQLLHTNDNGDSLGQYLERAKQIRDRLPSLTIDKQ